MFTSTKQNRDGIVRKSLAERFCARIPDPVAIFAALYVLVFVCSVLFGGTTFAGPSGETLTIQSMATAENVRWIFANCLVKNWVAYAHGMLPIVFVVMMGIGVAEQSGLFMISLRLLGRGINARLLPYCIVFAGMISNIASDAAYLVLLPLAGLLYATIGRHPLVGIAAAFAGVSAGFGANLIPATSHDVLIGVNALQFAQEQGVPAVSHLGAPLSAPTMDYFYLAAMCILITFVGGFVTNRFVAPRIEKLPWKMPSDLADGEMSVSPQEMRALRFGLLGLIVAAAVAVFFALGPLSPYVDAEGVRHVPFAENVIVFVAFAFFLSGVCCGRASGKYRNVRALIGAAAKQLGNCGYFAVLTFVAFNFLAMFGRSGLGAWIACSGARGLLALNLGSSPCLLIAVFVFFSAFVNCFISSLSAKWMLIGPVFVPMLYGVCHELTPEVVAAAYRTGDPATNILTPVMTFSGVVLVFCRRWKEDFTLGDQIAMMLPYTLTLLPASIVLLVLWFKLGLPFGF